MIVMPRFLRPMVLLLLAAAAALLPAVPLDLLYCRCTGSLTTDRTMDGCCEPPASPVPSCCAPSRNARPHADAGRRGSGGCMLAFQVAGDGAPASATRSSDAVDAPPPPPPPPPPPAPPPPRRRPRRRLPAGRPPRPARRPPAHLEGFPAARSAIRSAIRVPPPPRKP